MNIKILIQFIEVINLIKVKIYMFDKIETWKDIDLECPEKQNPKRCVEKS